MDRQMIIYGGYPGSRQGPLQSSHPDAVVEPEGPWKCGEYDDGRRWGEYGED